MNNSEVWKKMFEGASVGWVTIGDVTKYEQPTAYIVKGTDYNDLFSTPVLTAGKSFILGYTSDVNGIYEASNSPVIIFDDFTTARKWVNFDFKVKSSAMKMVTSANNDKYLLKYIFYWLDTLPSELIGGDHKRQWISNFANKIIPIPCPDDPEKSLAIQAEIVRILDAFTAVTAELTAELTRRRKQYEHYRDKLLTFEDGEVEWKTLGEVANFQNAKPHEKLVAHDGDITLLTAGYISSGDKSARFVRKADVLTPAFKNDVAMVMSDLPNGRALAKTFFIEENGRYAANQRVCLLTVKDTSSISPKFLYYVMNRNKQLLRYDSGHDQTHLKKDWILGVEIPIPSLAEQVRIVTALDKFDTLTTSPSQGLPGEIVMRKKQYEYYRDELLSFPKQGAETV